MARRPTDWYLVGLDKDPTPGDPEVLQDWERYFRRRADDAQQAQDRLRSIQSNLHALDLEGSWLTALWGRLDYMTDQLLPEKTVHDEVVDAFRSFRRQLPDIQSYADWGINQARQAIADRDSAVRELRDLENRLSAPDPLGLCTPASSTDINKRRSLQNEIDDANTRLAKGKRSIEIGAGQFQDAANEVVMALSDSEQVLGGLVFNPASPDTSTAKPTQPSLLTQFVEQVKEDLYGAAALTAGTLQGADQIGMNVEEMMMFGGPEGGGPGSEFALADGSTTTGLADTYAFGTDPFKEYDVPEGDLDDLWLEKNYEDRWTRKGPKPPKLRPFDLTAEESYGGHTVSKHVGKTDQFLRDRIKNEHVPAASTYISYTEAETYTNEVALANRPQIEAWLKSGKGRTQDFTAEFKGASIGKRISTEEAGQGIKPHPVDEATIVLKRDAAAPDRYYVVTSFPGPPD